jgi:serine protease inhibitor
VQPSLLSHVAAANDLTGRWCAQAGDGDFVLSGCGVWPLLSILADAADEPARTELATATTIAAADGRSAGLALLAELTAADSVSAALGAWVRRDIALREDWVRTLPAGTVEPLTGQPALDAWASDHTGGLIDHFPVSVQPDTLLILATAIVAKTAWRTPFHDDVLEPASGPWAGGRARGLARNSETLTDAALLAGPDPVTRVIVRGTEDLDVHLLLGADSPAGVLRTGLGALDGSVEAHTALRIGDTGPGLTVRQTRAVSDTLRIQLPPFEIQSTHDLLDHPDLFGLRAATDPRTGHFPALSDTPLRIDGAAQNARARFTREGFEAAAVTAMRMVRAVALHRPHTTTEIAVSFDRPFGFLAVHRPTGLVVVAGWVASLT